MPQPIEDLGVLARSELPVDTVLFARWLIGKIVVRGTPEGALSGRIVETEAYPVDDAAGHAFPGETARNRTLFLERGHAYVYLAYGLSYMLNVSSEEAGVGAATTTAARMPPLAQSGWRWLPLTAGVVDEGAHAGNVLVKAWIGIDHLHRQVDEVFLVVIGQFLGAVDDVRDARLAQPAQVAG